MLDKASAEGKAIVLLGDLNIDYKIDESLSENPIHLIENLYFLNQIVTKPTRVTRDSSKCLDLILSSVPEKHKLCDVAKLGLSDHYLVYTSIDYDVRPVKHKTVRFRDYKHFNQEAFFDDIKSCSFFEKYQGDYLEDESLWISWRTGFLNICDKHAPIKAVRVKDRYCPWITPEIVKLMYGGDYLKSYSTENNCSETFNEYRKVRNHITLLIRNTKRKYFDSVSTKYREDPKKMWNEIHKATGNNKYVSSMHPDLNCTEMNNFFTDIGKEISDKFNKVPLDWNHSKCPYIFTFDHVHENLIYKALLQLSNDSNLDVLDFDTKLLRSAAPHIFKSLTYIIKVSLKTGVFPG